MTQGVLHIDLATATVSAVTCQSVMTHWSFLKAQMALYQPAELEEVFGADDVVAFYDVPGALEMQNINVVHMHHWLTAFGEALDNSFETKGC